MNHVRKLLFIHIPKTAGLSIHSQLQSAFDSSRVIRFGNDSSLQKFQDMTYEELEKFDYITGHFTLAQARAKGITYPTIIIVRKPIDRLISMYRYLNQSNHPDHIQLKFNNFSSFVEYIRRTPVYHNLQCKYLCESGNFKDAIRIIGDEKLYIAPLEHLDDFLDTISLLLDAKIENIVKNASSKENSNQDRIDLSKLDPFINEDKSLYSFTMSNYHEIKNVFLQNLGSVQ